MGRYLGKRLISTIPLLLVISFVVFMFIHMIPGDPARLVAGQDATKEDVAVVREQLGLDEPLLVQYGLRSSVLRLVLSLPYFMAEFLIM